MSISLLPYSSADFETLYAIDRGCYPPGIAYSRRDLREFLEQAESDTLVAWDDKKIVGFLIAEARGNEAHIITIDVIEEQRRNGVGTALLIGIEQRLAAHGVGLVYLETATSNDAGVAFWQRHGYRSCGVLRGYYLGRMDAYLMRKSLDPLSAPAQ